jgi:hypothetical protein
MLLEKHYIETLFNPDPWSVGPEAIVPTNKLCDEALESRQIANYSRPKGLLPTEIGTGMHTGVYIEYVSSKATGVG